MGASARTGATSAYRLVAGRRRKSPRTAELISNNFEVSSEAQEGARMFVERQLSRAVIVSLAVAMFATACSKDNPTPTTAPSCAFSVVQPTTTFGPEGGTGSSTVTVTAGTGCTWTAASSATFITFTSGAKGPGSG